MWWHPNKSSDRTDSGTSHCNPGAMDASGYTSCRIKLHHQIFDKLLVLWSEGLVRQFFGRQISQARSDGREPLQVSHLAILNRRQGDCVDAPIVGCYFFPRHWIEHRWKLANIGVTALVGKASDESCRARGHSSQPIPELHARFNKPCRIKTGPAGGVGLLGVENRVVPQVRP